MDPKTPGKSTLNEFETRLQFLQHQIALKLYNLLNFDDDKEIYLSNSFWKKLGTIFNSEPKEALSMFLESYMRQSGRMAIDENSFIVNLVEASNQKKFGLEKLITRYPLLLFNIFSTEIEKTKLVIFTLKGLEIKPNISSFSETQKSSNFESNIESTLRSEDTERLEEIDETERIRDFLQRTKQQVSRADTQGEKNEEKNQNFSKFGNNEKLIWRHLNPINKENKYFIARPKVKHCKYNKKFDTSMFSNQKNSEKKPKKYQVLQNKENLTSLTNKNDLR